MRRSRELRLLLLGGGVALAVGACDDCRAACERARAIGDPDAARLCQRAAASGGGGSGYSGGVYSSGGGGSHSSFFGMGSARGGFGGTAGHVGS